MGSIEGIMMGHTITCLVAELRLPVVRRIIEAEESCPHHPVELHEVAHNMGTDRIGRNAALLHLTDGSIEFFPIPGKHHISLCLCGIATLQPIAVGPLLRGYGSTRLFHQPLELRTCAVLDTFR